MLGIGTLALLGNQAQGDVAKENPAAASPPQPAAAPAGQDADPKAPPSAAKEAKTDDKAAPQAATDDSKAKTEPPPAAAEVKVSTSTAPAKPPEKSHSPVFQYERWFYDQQNGADTWRPIDYAPGLARLYYKSLDGCRDRSLAGDLFIKSPHFRDSLNLKLKQLKTLQGDIAARRKTFQDGVARPSYESVRQVREAIQLRNEACHLLPLLIEHYAIMTGGAEESMQRDLGRLIAAAAQLDRLLAEEPAPQQANEQQAFNDWKQKVVDQAAQIGGLLDRFKGDFVDRYQKLFELIAAGGSDTLARRLADLAQSPLASPERREDLNRAARDHARSFAEVEKRASGLSLPTAGQQTSSQGWAGVESRAKLELALAGMALVEQDGNGKAAQEALAALNQATGVNARLAAVHKIDEVLYGAYRLAPQRAAERLRTKTYKAARSAETAIRLADPRDQKGIDNKVLGDRVLLNPIADLRLKMLPELTPVHTVALGTSEAMRLRFGVPAKLPVQFTSNQALADRLRFKLKYEDKRLQVKAQGAALGKDFVREIPLSPSANAAQERTVELELASLDERGGQSKLLLIWLDENDIELANDTVVLDHPDPVVAKLAVYGQRYTAEYPFQMLKGESYFDVKFEGGIAHVQLSPFTGHVTKYEFRLTNAAAIPKEYNVEIRSVPPSDSEQRPSPTAMAGAAQSRGDVLATNKLVIPPGEYRSIRFDSPPAAAQKEAAADAAKAAADKAAAAKAQPRDVRGGLVCFLTEVSKSAPAGPSASSGTSQIIVIEPKVQPPLYISSRLVYRNGEIEAVLSPPDEADQLPMEGANVRLEVFSDQLVSNVSAKFATTITPDNRNGDTLRAFVRGTPALAQVALHVDDYPRAFIYEFPLNVSLQDVVRKLDLSEIRLPDETKFPIYLDGKVPDPVPFRFSVDLPPNSDRSHRVRVFIADAAEGDFDPNTVMLEKYADRDHPIELVKVDDAPVLALRARTADLVAKLDLNAYENQPKFVRVQLVRKRQGVETVLKNAAVKIFLDGKPPTVYVDPRTKEVVEKIPFTVALHPEDDISGVKQVEFAFGTQPNPDPKAEIREVLANPSIKGIKFNRAKNEYQLELAFDKPGNHTVYVQATDRRGNKSAIAECLITVRPAPTEVVNGKEVPVEKPGRIVGRAMLREGARGSVTTVILKDAAGAEIDRRTPADNGRFSFDNLKPGKYSLEARGFIGGNEGKSDPTPVNVESGKPTDEKLVKIR
jgi:hypothetical protein